MQHSNSTTEEYEPPLAEDDKWTNKPMKIAKTQADVSSAEDQVQFPTYKNENTHWWDGSQIYGSTEEETKNLRSKCNDGKLAVDTENGEDFLPRGPKGIPQTGFNTNWWLGLELLHTLFALEHNAICDELRKHYPNWTSDQFFDKARLINCALMAKIHTVEWTPAILAHPTIDIVLHANCKSLPS